MEIKELIENDVVKIVELISEYKLESSKEITKDDREEIKNLLKEIICSDNSCILAAKDGEKILGYICYHIYNFPLILGKECYISDLLVSSKSRGEGTGKGLIDAVESKAKEKRAIRLILNNPKEALSYKRSFYSKIGFTERDNFANFVKPLSTNG